MHYRSDLCKAEGAGSAVRNYCNDGSLLSQFEDCRQIQSADFQQGDDFWQQLFDTAVPEALKPWTVSILFSSGDCGNLQGAFGFVFKDQSRISLRAEEIMRFW